MRLARESNGRTELGRLVDEVLRCLGRTDLYGVNAALEKVLAEAAFWRGDEGSPRSRTAAWCRWAYEAGYEPEIGVRAYRLLTEKGAGGRGASSLAQVQAEAPEKIVRNAPGQPTVRGASDGHRAEVTANKGAVMGDVNKTELIEELADRDASRDDAKRREDAFARVDAAVGAQAGAPPLPSGLPPGYALDASDPELLLLIRGDGTMATAFNARGAIARGVVQAAEQDVHPAPNGRRP